MATDLDKLVADTSKTTGISEVKIREYIARAKIVNRVNSSINSQIFKALKGK